MRPSRLRGRVGIGLALTLVSAMAPAAAAQESRFVDIAGSVHEPAIETIAALGITLGCNPPANDRFCPEDLVTRGQMAAFLVRAFVLPDAGTSGFTDTLGSMFENEIDRLAAAAITKGCNPLNTLYCPEEPVTRGQMAAFLVRTLGLTPVAGERFTDTATSIFEAEINALATAGITLGCNPPANDRFCPEDLVTRAQMASFLVRSLSVIEPPPPPPPPPPAGM